IHFHEGWRDAGRRAQEWLNDLANGNLWLADREWVFEALCQGEAAVLGQGMVGCHNDANGHVSSEGDVDLTGWPGEKAEADVDTLIHQPLHHFGRWDDGYVEREARITSAEVGNQLREEGEAHAFRCRDAYRPGPHAAQQFNFRYGRLHRSGEP